MAQGILELHSKGILVLNLKPSNVLLDENDKAILGDFGVPYLLLGSPCPSSEMVRRLGTPYYMAPEQWQPEVRGPIHFETDSWGFGCTIVELLTGVHPWRGKHVDEIYHSVVRKQEKPHIPCGLSSPVENVLLGCFEYDLRNRPLISDILQVFKRYKYLNTSFWVSLDALECFSISKASTFVPETTLCYFHLVAVVYVLLLMIYLAYTYKEKLQFCW